MIHDATLCSECRIRTGHLDPSPPLQSLHQNLYLSFIHSQLYYIQSFSLSLSVPVSSTPQHRMQCNTVLFFFQLIPFPISLMFLVYFRFSWARKKTYLLCATKFLKKLFTKSFRQTLLSFINCSLLLISLITENFSVVENVRHGAKLFAGFSYKFVCAAKWKWPKIFISMNDTMYFKEFDESTNRNDQSVF